MSEKIIVKVDKEFAELWNNTVYGLADPIDKKAINQERLCGAGPFMAWVGWQLHKKYLEKSLSEDEYGVIELNEGDELQKCNK